MRCGRCGTLRVGLALECLAGDAMGGPCGYRWPTVERAASRECSGVTVLEYDGAPTRYALHLDEAEAVALLTHLIATAPACVPTVSDIAGHLTRAMR